MVVVSGTRLLGAALHYRRGNFNSKAALFFGLSGMVGAYFGAYLTPLFSERVLLAIFAILMLIVGVAMLRQKSATSDLEEKCYLVRCVVIGALVGALTGFVGVGGGFMIVPAGAVRRHSGRTGRGNLSRYHRSQRGFRFRRTDSKDLHRLVADILLSWIGDPRNARRNGRG